MTDAEPDLIAGREGSAGIIRLNRPKAINALTLPMVRDIMAALDAFEADPAVAVIILEGAGERGLCAGGDIRSLYDSAKSGGDLGREFWREEYILNARIAHLSKPYVAFMDGIVMGGGIGLSAHGRHRIVSEKSKLAMPEVGIGFFPDVGGTWLLARLPGEIGTYFGLTGHVMNGADAIAADFADIFIPTEKWPAARAALCALPQGAGNMNVKLALKKFASPAGDAPVAAQRAVIDRLFAFETVDEIVAALEKDGSDFAREALATMKTKSPTSMVVTLRLLREARKSKSLKECLAREFIAAQRVFKSDEFLEGVRAAVVDKDRNPKWQPPTLAGVTAQIVDAYFDTQDKEILTFPA